VNSHPALQIEALSVTLPAARGIVHAVRNVNLAIAAGEMLALVGESGCGKSVTAQAIMGLLPDSARTQAHTALFNKQPLMTGKYQKNIAMIFQNPMATFNPLLTIGYQIAEPLRLLHGYNRKDAEHETVRLLERMQIVDARQKAQRYAHEFSGGMLQRAAIAMALACKPELLIADEPTTALDVSTQAEVMALLTELRVEQNLSMLFITHDLGLVSHHADRIAVMYAGEIIETASTSSVLDNPAHPYTRALLAALPIRHSNARLAALEGSPPDLRFPPPACAFAERCAQAMPICKQQSPPVVERHHAARCWLHNTGHTHE
jgi:oligopeptide/dipeptide ABC transporter ATP-binding protein